MVDKEKRSFLNLCLWGSGLLWLGSIVFPVGTYLWPKEEEAPETEKNVGKVDDFKNDTGTIIPFGGKPAIIIRTAEGEFKAFEAVCTHLDCTVQYRPDFGMIWCACHNGKYDLTGKNISGPPPRPLIALSIRKTENDEIIISRT